jgi:tripeptide aminopeptidase
VTIAAKENPELVARMGDTIITASGDTLLGADDKAGIAEILATLAVLKKDSSIKHPTLRIAFTPDEEVGRGASFFDLERFAAHCAYTVDGDIAGEVNVETFSADKAVVTFTGVAVHPGFAKGRMVNAIRSLGRFLDRLPREKSPERTELRQGFIHPTSVKGNASEATAEMILRDFENDKLAALGEEVRALAASVAEEEPRLKVDVKITEQYRNMADTLRAHPEVGANLIEAVKDAGLAPKIVAIRGGTDGSGLTARGLPTPNIFAGGMNFHGPREWVSTRVMALAVCSMLNLAQLWAGK